MKLFPATLPFFVLFLLSPIQAAAEFQAGAAVVDVTPLQLPVLVNGGFLSRSVHKVKTQLSARAIVIDDGQQRLGIVVVDSCMMPRPFLDEAKQAGLLELKGHRSVGGIRASIYNAMPEEGIDALIDFMADFERRA